MPQYVAYSQHPQGRQEAVPIATGETREECLRKAVPRTLAAQLVGDLHVQRRDDIDAETYAQLTAHLAQHFKQWGID